jgi:hypothetical protein
MVRRLRAKGERCVYYWDLLARDCLGMVVLLFAGYGVQCQFYFTALAVLEFVAYLN